FDGAEPVRTRRQGEREAYTRLRPDLSLELHMRRRPGAERAEFALRQASHPRLGAESELDIPREIPLIVDVAGWAMRAVRQLVQMPDAQLGAAAARTKEVPAHGQDAALVRGKKEFDRGRRHRSPLCRERQRPQAAQHDAG